MKKLQLGLIFGGRSCEHEVSVISALQLSHSVDRAKYDLYPIYINKSGEWFSGPGLLTLDTYKEPIMYTQKGKYERVMLDVTAHSGALVATRPGRFLYSRPQVKILAHLDCVIPVMHGLHGEDGTLQGLLELADIPYASTGVAGSAASMDKILMKHIFRSGGIPVLPDVTVLRSEWRKKPQEIIGQIENALPYPVFVKPANLGSSIGVSRADNAQELSDALNLACAYDRRILVEKGLDKPLEVNCSVLGFDDEARASVVEMPVTGGALLDFKGKYLAGGGSKGMASLNRVIPAPIGEELTQRVQELSMQVFRLMDCKGVVRIDWMIEPSTDELYITEINTIPGSLSFYLWKETQPRLSYPRLVDTMVEYALKAHKEKSDNNYAYRSDLFNKMSLGGAKGTKGSKT